MKTHRVAIGKKSKELICFSEVVIMLEMLRNWGEPALLALDIYQIIKDANFTNFHKKRSRNHAFHFHKGKGICREHDKCRKYNREQVFLIFCNCSQLSN